MKIAVLGIDLGKNVCSVVGLDRSGAVVLRRRVRRDTLIDLVGKTADVALSAWRHVAAPIILVACSQPGARGSSDVTGVCAALCQGTEER